MGVYSNKEKVRIVLSLICGIIGVACFIYMIIYWACNSELTKMQIFLNKLHVWVIGFGSCVLGMIIIKNE